MENEQTSYAKAACIRRSVTELKHIRQVELNERHSLLSYHKKT